MVAGMLQRLGIFMGPKLTEDGEDSDFTIHRGNFNIFAVRGHPSHAGYLKSIGSVIASRNKRYSVWGWKDPIAIFYLPTILPLLRNVHYIFITRDWGAVAQREVAEGALSGGLLEHMQRVARLYSMIFEFIAAQQSPTLMISYERALRHPEAVAEPLMAFTNRQDAKFVEWSRGFIRPRYE
jgi:hypothetical protein